MNLTSSFTTARRHALKIAVVAVLTMASSMSSEPAKAGMPVIDYTAIAQAAKNFQDQLTRWKATWDHYGKVISHYTEQVAFWQQQLNKLRNLDLQLFDIEQNFTEIAPDYGVDIMCPGASPSSIVDKVTSSLASMVNPKADIVGEQQKMCVKIVMTQNRKYNDTIVYLQSLRKQTDSFMEITDMRLKAIGNSPGNTEGLMQETERYSANLQLAKEKWQTSMDQYDVQLELLKQQQMVLSKRALNGQPSIWGTLVNTAVLQGALKLNQ